MFTADKNILATFLSKINKPNWCSSCPSPDVHHPIESRKDGKLFNRRLLFEAGSVAPGAFSRLTIKNIRLTIRHRTYKTLSLPLPVISSMSFSL